MVQDAIDRLASSNAAFGACSTRWYQMQLGFLEQPIYTLFITRKRILYKGRVTPNHQLV